MNRTILLSLLAVALLHGPAATQEHGFGLGVIVGEPTGISAKKWIKRNVAVAGAMAWSFGKHDALQLHGDYLIHNFKIFKVEEGLLPLYYGIGARMKLEKDDKVGVRVPLGIDFILADAPLDFFLEIVPLLDVAPSTEFDLNAAIGARYLFDRPRQLKH